MKWVIPLLMMVGALAGPLRGAPIVRFDTNLGVFDVELYESAMPETVANFLQYVSAGLYTSTIFHRSTTYNPGGIQIVQGGGFELNGSLISAVSTFPPISLETGPLNLRGTIAMARSNDPDSATSQFYFNVQNNADLDGNYAVFGEILGLDGLMVLDALAATPVYNASSRLGAVFGELPLLQPDLSPANLLIVESVVLIPEPGSLTLLIVTGVLGTLCSRPLRRLLP